MARSRRGRAIVRTVALCAFFVAASACAAVPGPSQDAVNPGQQPPTKGPTGGPERADAESRPIRSVEGLIVGTPIYNGDFADPFVLSFDEVAYAYATNTGDANVPVLRWVSQDRAEYLGDALPSLPAWTHPGLVWAPAVWARPDGQYVLYYTTVDVASGRQCVSRAIASYPGGPFTDDSGSAFVCPLALGGAIDPAVYVDGDGTTYLIYKNDGNCCGIPTQIWSVPLSEDGMSLAGEPVALLGADQGWEGSLIEGPAMVGDRDRYYLFYSANAWDTASYAVGWAECDSVRGPCRKLDDRAWFSSTGNAKGPGGQEFFRAGGRTWMVYHGWLPGEVGGPDGERRLYLDQIALDGEAPKRVGREGALLALAWFAAPFLLAGLAVGGLVVWLVRRRRRRES